MKIMRFRQDSIIRNKMLGVNNVFTLALYNRTWLLDVVTVINDNLNMYINDHLRMYTSDYALI